MNDQKTIKKIINLAVYDFSNNFIKWFSIAGLHAITLTIMYCGLCFAIADYSASYWGWAPNIIFDWTTKLYGFLSSGISSWILGVTTAGMMSCFVLMPLIFIQNALDLAFDSAMRGFSLQGLAITTYVGAMIMSNSLLWCFMKLLSSIFIFIVLFLMQTNFAIHPIIVQIAMLSMSFLVLYYMQMTYLLSMHILEYKKGFVQSYKDLFAMVAGNSLFLCKILLLQSLFSLCSFVVLYYCLGAVIKVLLPIILWFFRTLQLEVHPLLLQMMYNFFYLWAYVLLYAWACLVLAHVYRQLVCPPVDNPSCASCNSCEK